MHPIRLLGATELCTNYGCIYIPDASGPIAPQGSKDVLLKHESQGLGAVEGGEVLITFFFDERTQPRETLTIAFPPLPRQR